MVKNFFNKYRKLHIWLIALVVFLAVYFVARQSRNAMNWMCSHILFPLEHAIAALCSHTSISVAEVLIVTAICVLLLFLGRRIGRLFFEKGKRKRILYTTFMILLCSLISIYAGFCLLWGNAYNTDSFQEQAGITARGGTIEELTQLTKYFAQNLAQVADQVERDEQGVFTTSVDETLNKSTTTYDWICEEYSFLDGTVYTPKAITCSYAMSLLDFTGFYFPFTGESNVNIDAPLVYLAETATHEIAHQKGVASEQECSFLAILACTNCDDVSFQYSGWLAGYVYLANALYRVDQEAWKEVRAMLSDSVVTDLQYNSAYWASMRGTVQTVSNKVYDSFLKSNGDSNGILSYGTVVNLLLAYYE